MLTHKSKARKFLTSGPSKKPRPAGEAPTSPPPPRSLEEMSRTVFASRPQKSDLPPEQVRETFQNVLSDMGLHTKSLKVQVKRATTLAEVLFDEERNVELNYDDNYFRTLSKEEVEAMLSHEACHIVTLPHAGIQVVESSPEIMEMQISFVELYDEFLAHEEFYRRFRGKSILETYRNIKISEFRSYEKILTMSWAGMPSTKALYTILNDAVFFPTIEDASFHEWCDKNHVHNIGVFLNWLLEDFKYIGSLHLDRLVTMELVILSGVLSVGVDADALLKRDRIVFLESAEGCEQMALTKNSHLAGLWQERRRRIVAS